MLTPLVPEQIAAFTRACARERVFGSRILTALRAYGLDNPAARFFHLGEDAALYLAGGVLLISAAPGCDPAPVAALIRREGVTEVDTNWPQCEALQRLLGGTTESSYYMEYRGPRLEPDASGLEPGELPAVFDVLRRSHEYYRAHFTFDAWSGDLRTRLDKGLMELWQLREEGQIIGTGSIIAEDEECGVIAAVAVVPECRHRGLGAHISRFLTGRVLERGKTPRLISGYDGVAQLYRRVGFETRGRWGELYL